MNTLTSTAESIGDQIACGEVVWDYVCEMDPPPNGDSWDAAWTERAESRYDELMEKTDLSLLPSDLMDRLDAMVDERKVWRQAA